MCLQELRERLSSYEDSEVEDGPASRDRPAPNWPASQEGQLSQLQQQLAAKSSLLGKLSDEVVAIKREAEVR